MDLKKLLEHFPEAQYLESDKGLTKITPLRQQFKEFLE
jgi:hypothetical protein